MTARLSYLSIYSGSYNEQSFVKKARRYEKRGNARRNTCPRGKNNVEQIRLLSAAEDSPRMEITIGNLTYNALMDMGATQCFIGERMLVATGCLPEFIQEAPKNMVICAVGIEHKPVGQVTLLVEWDNFKTPMNFYILKDDVCSLIIGHNFMRRVGLDLHTKEGYFSCSRFPGVHIPYVPYELRFRELSLKTLHVFGNHEILSSLDWDEKLVAGSDCTPAQRLLLKDVLTSVSGVFSENPGCSLTHEHGITLKKDAKMPKHPFRTFNPAKKAIMIKLVEELESLGLIERATGDFISYPVIVSKPDESDAQALKWLMSMPEPSGRFGRWDIRIQSGAFKIIYRQGRLNCVSDALSRAPLPTEDIPADNYLETKEPTRYWPDWNGNEPVDSPSKEEIKSTELSGEGEGDTDEEQKVTLYSALTDLLNEVPPTRVKIIAEQRKDPFCILITEYLMLDDEQKKKKNEKFSKEFKEKAKRFLLDAQMTETNTENSEPDPYGMIVKFHPTFEEELNDSGAGFKAYIPPTLIRRIIFACHGHPLSGHAGISKTLHRTQQLCLLSTSTYHSNANPTERANRDLKIMLAIFTDIHSKWPRYLDEFAFVSRTNVSEALGSSPMLLNTGRVVTLPFDPRLLKHAVFFDKTQPELYVKDLMGVLAQAHQNMYIMMQ
uniref:Retropepsins domain-containing protein n=1 Tax=Strigamia maritima TaxID=126957 RepID=T1IIL8_STRMM